MNCKPGDLAVIVSPDTSTRNLGRLVQVVRQSEAFGNGWWLVECMSPAYVNRPGQSNKSITSRVGSIEDRRLRPIRPGDISDEEVRDLYAPKQPEVA